MGFKNKIRNYKRRKERICRKNLTRQTPSLIMREEGDDLPETGFFIGEVSRTMQNKHCIFGLTQVL
jgi:hypothetical protein